MLVGALWLYLLVSVASSAGTLDGGRGAWIRVPQSAETRDPVGGGEKRCATKNAARRSTTVSIEDGIGIGP